MTVPHIRAYRRKQVRQIPTPIGVYALCDLDEVPIYVGQSTDGIQARVRRHLTSARSDVIANRQMDVWEIAYVWAWPVQKKAQISPLEAFLFHRFQKDGPLMNGTFPANPGRLDFPVPERARVQIMSDDEIKI